MRELEILVGLEDDERLLLNGQIYRQQFVTQKDDFSATLDRRLAAPSLKEALYTCLAHMTVPNREEYSTGFIAKKVSQYEGKKVDLKVKQGYWEKLLAKIADFSDLSYAELLGYKGETVDGLAKLLEAHGLEYRCSDRAKTLLGALQAKNLTVAKEQIADWVNQDKKMAQATIKHMEGAQKDVDTEIKVLNDFFNDKTLIDERRPNTKHLDIGTARRAALYLLSHPWTQPAANRTKNDYSEWSLLLSTVLKLEQGLVLWRSRHARMVEIMIGRRSGTGGSSGVSYLDNTATLRVYQDLWRIRALLIPASAIKI